MRCSRNSLRTMVLATLVSCVPGPVGDSWAAGGKPDPTVTTVQITSSSTVDIDGTIGGAVTCGRWTVLVPPGAYAGVGSITITLANKTGLACDLSINPGSLNKFNVPVQLSFSVEGMPVDPTYLTIYRYDLTTRKWIDQHAIGDRGNQTVTAYLSHFSTYALGKAGW